MSTATQTFRPRSTERPRLTFGTTMASEWKKFFTVRSTIYASAITVVIAALFALLIAATTDSGVIAAGSAAANGQGDPQQLVGPGIVAGVSFSQLVVGILAVLIVTSEYTTGLIQSTLVSNPRRLSVLAAKTVVAAVTAVVLGVIAWGLSAVIALPIYASNGYHVALTDPWIIGGLGTMVVFLFIVALFGVFVGTIVRSNAAGIAVVVGVLFVLPILCNFLPQSSELPKYLLPISSQTVATAIYDPAEHKDFVTALVVTVGWLVVTGVGAAVLLRKRDV